jgi:hypothetical protein
MANQILAGAVFQAGQVIAGVDADNPPYVGPPVAKWITRSLGGYPRPIYLRSVIDIDADPTTITNTSPYFGTNVVSDPNGNYLAVSDQIERKVFIYDTQDLTAAPTEITTPSGHSNTGQSMCMTADKIFVGQNPVYAYDLSDLSAAPTTISAPASEVSAGGFGSDLACNSTHLFIGSQYARINQTGGVQASGVNSESGKVHVWNLSTEQYETSLYGTDTEYGDKFGSEIRVTDTHVAIGAHGADSSSGYQPQTGAVYLFDAQDLSATPTKLTGGGYGDEYGRAIDLNSTHLAVSEGNYSGSNLHENGRLFIYPLTNLSNPTIKTGNMYAEQYGTYPQLFKDGSNRISFHRNLANQGGTTKFFVYNISDLDTPLWESETEQPILEMPAYVAPPPPPPATVADMTIDDWTVIGSNELIANPGGGINTEFWWRRNDVNTSVAYYEIINMVPGESYELTFEVKLASGTGPTGVEVHRTADASFLMASTYTNGGYQSQTLSWTQPAGLTKAYMHLVSQNSGGVGEMRNAVLTKVS